MPEKLETLSQHILDYKAADSRPWSAAKCLIVCFAGTILWVFVLTVLFGKVPKVFLWGWGFTGPLSYSLPLAITLTKWFPSRWHALWLAPLSYPLSVLFIYESIVFAASFPRLATLRHFADPRVLPGSEYMSVALIFATASTVLAIILYFIHDRAQRF